MSQSHPAAQFKKGDLVKVKTLAGESLQVEVRQVLRTPAHLTRINANYWGDRVVRGYRISKEGPLNSFHPVSQIVEKVTR